MMDFCLRKISWTGRRSKRRILASMDWIAVQFERSWAKLVLERATDWTAVEFDEVMGKASLRRATAWTGQRSSSMRSWAKLLLRRATVDWTAVEFEVVEIGWST
jgi:hypothetical protein